MTKYSNEFKVKAIKMVLKGDSIFTILMGDKVEPRRRFIEEHANLVRNLDL